MLENPADEKSFTIDEFCLLEKISRATFFKLARNRQGPEVLRIAGTVLVRITASARLRWHERMAALAEEEAAQVERRRRADQASRAGKAATSSPRHVSKRGRRITTRGARS
jgi:hypothetical protein